ncbi:MAG: transposase [Firmicutes bacterium]|nr:transposase [Bacillota bacterium]
MDGGKGLHKAVKDVFGENVQIQRCQIHKLRNVQSYLPESEQRRVKAAMNRAYMEFEYQEAKNKLERLAKELEFKYPSASASLMEGLEETLTVHKLKVPGLLRATLSNTNPIESAIGTALNVTGRVKNWQSGNQVLRWISSGFILAEEKFKTIKGYKQIPFLIDALNNKKPAELSQVG